MKRIIDGKRYNTETAQEVATSWNGYARNDFNFCEETLYRTPRGNWFIYGNGGPMSPYNRSVGDLTAGDERIVPVDAERARSWLENADEAEALEKWFPDQIEDA